MSLHIHSDEYFMSLALKEAQLAFEAKEIPVGAVIVSENRVIAKAHNQTEQLNDVTAHAEMLALTAAQNYLGSKYLNDCKMYVTLEPCVMCGGALFWSQIGELHFAASDVQRGYRRMSNSILHPKTSVKSGLLEPEASSLIQQFFKKLR